MIDYLHAFADEAAAQADPVVGSYFVPGSGWSGFCAVPNMEVWVPGEEFLIDSQWRVLITLPELDDVMTSQSSCELVWDDSNGELLKNSFRAKIATLMMQPVLSGRVYPFLATPPT
jgi:hypothetical protein